jgi:hypothetical protein
MSKELVLRLIELSEGGAVSGILNDTTAKYPAIDLHQLVTMPYTLKEATLVLGHLVHRHRRPVHCIVFALVRS